MLTRLYFKNFEPSSSIREFVQLVLTRTLDLAPYGSTGVALIEKQDHEYRCSLDIYSAQGLFATSVLGSSPNSAVGAAERNLKKQIQKWSENRSQYQVRFLEAVT